MKAAKPKDVKPVRMWAIADGSRLNRILDGTMELYKTKKQSDAMLKDIDEIGLLPPNVRTIPVLVTPERRKPK
jgi:hypothetical protein